MSLDSEGTAKLTQSLEGLQLYYKFHKLISSKTYGKSSGYERPLHIGTAVCMKCHKKIRFGSDSRGNLKKHYMGKHTSSVRDLEVAMKLSKIKKTSALQSNQCKAKPTQPTLAREPIFEREKNKEAQRGAIMTGLLAGREAKEISDFNLISLQNVIEFKQEAIRGAMMMGLLAGKGPEEISEFNNIPLETVTEFVQVWSRDTFNHKKKNDIRSYCVVQNFQPEAAFTNERLSRAYEMENCDLEQEIMSGEEMNSEIMIDTSDLEVKIEPGEEENPLERV